MKAKISSLFEQYKIKSISYDSRNIAQESAFFAIKGGRFDGNLFIDEALKKAAIVFTEDQRYCKDRVFYVENIRLAVSIAAGIIYPRLPRNLIAVTGTNGKSSVVSYIYQILSLLRASVATLGTLGIDSSVEIDKSFLEALPSNLTTIDPINFRKILDMLASINIDNVAFEASSHGIHQYRLGEVQVKTAGFTSFSQDHLDYHKTMEDYLIAKLQLLVDNLQKGGELVINAEILNSSYGDIVKEFLEKEKINCCLVGDVNDNLVLDPRLRGDDNSENVIPASSNVIPAEAGIQSYVFRSGYQIDVRDGIKIKDTKCSLSGFNIEFYYKNKIYQFSSSVIGSFQAINMLIAAKLVANIGFDFDSIVDLLGKIKSAPGRLERANNPDDAFHIFVDYAHTPDSLEKSLLELKKIKAQDGKLYVVFGCGGERDALKRSVMGQVAAALADYVIVTDDNPRGEDPEKIRLEILKGAKGAEQIGSRELAIENAIERLQKNDILLIAGKGHENYQIIGDKILFFSDIEVAKKLADLKRDKSR